MSVLGKMRFETLTSWLTITAVLCISASGDPGRHSPTVYPRCKIRGQLGVRLILKCGDGKKTGSIQLWHTPFGDLRPPDLSSPLDPVFMNQDRHLVIRNSSLLHGGLYFCVLRHSTGTHLWPYELCVDPVPEHRELGKEAAGCEAPVRVRRDAGSEGAGRAGVSDGRLAVAVAVSVLLTFVAGFSAGALSRTPLLRCLRAIIRTLRPTRTSPDGAADRGSQFHMTPVVPERTGRSFGAEGEKSRNSSERNLDRSVSPPPAKPRRSFQLQEEREETLSTAYLEGCDYIKVEKWRFNGEGGKKEEADGSGGRQDEPSESHSVEEGIVKKGEDRKEEDDDGDEEGVDTGSEAEGESTSSEDTVEEAETGSSGGAEHSSANAGSGRAPAARRRVIRLYQYDDDGRKYGHLPEGSCEGEVADGDPRPKQRSLSLTRLSTIMVAALDGPLDRRETESAEGEATPRFQMDI